MKAVSGQRGFSLVSAIFLVVVLAALGAYIITIGAVQQTATALSLQGVRAYFAAETGREWAVYEATTSQSTHDAICQPGGKTTSFTLAGGALNGFQVQVTCDDFKNPPPGKTGGFQEGDDWYDLERVDVTASQGGGPANPDYVSRHIRAMVTTGAALPP